MFAVGNIIEQCIVGQSCLHINFVSFQKAFHNIYIVILRGRSCDFAGMINQMMRAIFINFNCSVLHEGIEHHSLQLKLARSNREACYDNLCYWPCFPCLMKERTIEIKKTWGQWTLIDIYTKGHGLYRWSLPFVQSRTLSRRENGKAEYFGSESGTEDHCK